MHRDFIERKQQLERRISYLEQKVQDKKQNHLISFHEHPFYQRGFSADATVKNLSKPPIQRRLQPSKIQQLQQIVKVTVERQHVLEEEIVHLKNMLGKESRGESRMQYSPDSDNEFGHKENMRLKDRQKQKNQPPRQDSKFDRLPLKQMKQSGNIERTSFVQKKEQDNILLSHSDSSQSFNHKFSKSLTVTHRPAAPKISFLHEPQLDNGKLSLTMKSSSERVSSKRIKISLGTKKYVSSMIIMRMKCHANESSKSKTKPKSKSKNIAKVKEELNDKQKQKGRSDVQFLELMERRNQIRKDLLKKVFKIKNVKRYK